MKLTTTLLIISILFLGCSDETPLEKERREMNEHLAENTPLTIYKGTKMAIRSLPIDKADSTVGAFFQNIKEDKSKSAKLSKYTVSFLEKVYGITENETVFSAAEYLELYTAFQTIKKELIKTDEDTFPTLLEVFTFINEISEKEKSKLIEELKWSSAKEHLILGFTFAASKKAPPAFHLYELSRLKMSELPNNEVKPFCGIVKGLVFMQHGWFYLADEALSQGIEEIETEEIELSYKNFPVVFNGAEVETKEAQMTQFHGISCLLRGYSRYKTEDDEMREKAAVDFQQFATDAEKLGLDNEFTWIAGAYGNIYQENPEEAIKYLTKLENSTILGETEKEAFAEIKGFVEEREPEKALNIFFDNVFIGKLIYKYVMSYTKQVDWYSVLEDSETGKYLLEMNETIDNEYNKIVEQVSPDKLKEKGKDLVKDLF